MFCFICFLVEQIIHKSCVLVHFVMPEYCCCCHVNKFFEGEQVQSVLISRKVQYLRNCKYAKLLLMCVYAHINWLIGKTSLPIMLLVSSSKFWISTIGWYHTMLWTPSRYQTNQTDTVIDEGVNCRVVLSESCPPSTKPPPPLPTKNQLVSRIRQALERVSSRKCTMNTLLKVAYDISYHHQVVRGTACI